MRNVPRSPVRRRQAGFSMVELSVAMVVALFLLAGLFTMEQSTRKASQQQTLLAQLQDNQRLAMTILTDVIQSAGYFSDPSTNTLVGSLPSAAPLFSTAGQGIYGTTTAGQDTIYIQYMSQGHLTDNVILCNGQQAPDATPGIAYINSFSVAGGNLQCSLSTNIASTITAVPNSPFVLVEGLQSMTIQYGVATTGTNGYSVDTYMTAAQVQAANRWLDVSSVKVTLSFKNPLYGQPGYTSAASQFVNFERVIGLMARAGV